MINCTVVEKIDDEQNKVFNFLIENLDSDFIDCIKREIVNYIGNVLNIQIFNTEQIELDISIFKQKNDSSYYISKNIFSLLFFIHFKINKKDRFENKCSFCLDFSIGDIKNNDLNNVITKISHEIFKILNKKSFKKFIKNLKTETVYNLFDLNLKNHFQQKGI